MEGISGAQMLIGLGIGLLALILLILKTKIHVFIALIIASCIIGLAGGMAPNAVAGAITKGFGGTLGSIGIIIGLGVMLGQIFEESGAAERMARTFLKVFGKGHEELAMAVTGYIVSIAIFCDSGFVILSPLAKALSKEKFFKRGCQDIDYFISEKYHISTMEIMKGFERADKRGLLGDIDAHEAGKVIMAALIVYAKNLKSEDKPQIWFVYNSMRNILSFLYHSKANKYTDKTKEAILNLFSAYTDEHNQVG